MEVISNSVEDKLIDGLSYKLEPTASYITERKSATFWAQGSNQYSPNGVKVIKLLLNGDNWLDPSTVKVMFNLTNLENKVLRTIGGPWPLVRRLRVLCNGALIEDIDYYNHVHQMFDVLQSENVRNNEDVEGFGIRADGGFGNKLINAPLDLDTAELAALGQYVSVNSNGSKAVSLSLLSGILNQGKMLPLKYCPITIELELVNNFYDPIISGALANDGRSAVIMKLGLTAANTSSIWQLDNVQIKADIVRMDNQLENEFAQRFLSGQSIPINYSTYISQIQALSGQNTSVNVTRAISRLKSVFLTFAPNSNFSTNTYPLVPAENFTDEYLHNPWAWLHDWNDFYHPMDSGPYYDHNRELEIQVQCGSKMFPEYPIRSTQEAFSHLRKCMGIQNSTFHSVDVSALEYRQHKFIVGIDTEKVLAASFTGENLKSGSLITIKLKIGSGTPAAAYPAQVYVILHSDQIMNIRDTGVEVLD